MNASSSNLQWIKTYFLSQNAIKSITALTLQNEAAAR